MVSQNFLDFFSRRLLMTGLWKHWRYFDLDEKCPNMLKLWIEICFFFCSLSLLASLIANEMESFWHVLGKIFIRTRWCFRLISESTLKLNRFKYYDGIFSKKIEFMFFFQLSNNSFPSNYPFLWITFTNLTSWKFKTNMKKLNEDF